jgi:hypothetical protein
MRRVVDISASRSGNRVASGDSCSLDLVDLLGLVDLLALLALLALLDVLDLRTDFFADLPDFLDDLDRAEVLGI